MAVIYAANQGHLDRVPVETVPEVNEAIRRELRERGADLLAEIRDTKELSDEAAAKIDAIVADVVKRYAEPEPAPAAAAPAEEAPEPAPAAA